MASDLSPLIVDNKKSDLLPIQHSFPNEHLLATATLPWYANIVNYLVTEKIPSHWSSPDKKRFLAMARYFYFDDPYFLNIVLTK